MEIKVFGRSLFEIRTKGSGFIELGRAENSKSKQIPDFYAGYNRGSYGLLDYVTPVDSDELMRSLKAKKDQPADGPDAKKVTPKEVHDMKTLHSTSFRLITDKKYVDDQIAAFTEKLSLLKKTDEDVRNAVAEVGSVLMRLENRKSYAAHKKFFDEYPYTTTELIQKLVAEHTHLQLGTVGQFMADMPKEAADTMKAYTAECRKLCGKEAIFYIIADKKDFKKTAGRRDPILLAQSPFGHVWQILGAWDAEMLLVDEL